MYGAHGDIWKRVSKPKKQSKTESHLCVHRWKMISLGHTRSHVNIRKECLVNTCVCVCNFAQKVIHPLRMVFANIECCCCSCCTGTFSLTFTPEEKHTQNWTRTRCERVKKKEKSVSESQNTHIYVQSSFFGYYKSNFNCGAEIKINNAKNTNGINKNKKKKNGRRWKKSAGC